MDASALHSRPALLRGLSPEVLLDAALAATGEWHALDSASRHALDVLTTSLREEAQLSDAGLLGAQLRLLRILIARLRAEATLEAQPEIRAVPIVRPVVIAGLPRAGTTLLHHLLAQDPAARSLPLCELLSPSPPPEAVPSDADPRVAASNAFLARLDRQTPLLRALHPMESRGPDECGWLLCLSLRARRFAFDYDVPTYTAWLRSQDHREPYRLYRALLQMLAWRRPGQWLILKDPAHGWHLPALADALPDARIVFVHREPLEVVRSTARLMRAIRSLGAASRDETDLSAEIARDLREGMRSVAAWSERAPGRRHDLRYADLLRDPLGQVRRLYAALELPWSDAMETASARHLAQRRLLPSPDEEPRGNPGEGVPEDVAETFATYRERFL